MFKKLFCSHDYEKIDHFEMKSEFDIIHESGFSPKTSSNIKRLIVTDYKCTKCNKLKRLEATTP